MKEIKFPLLKEYQIEVRVGQVSQKGCTLLLYKTSRTDAEILDSVVGMGNWQKRFYTLQGVGIGERERSIVVCEVGIYDDDKHEWVWKSDSGTESEVEQDKGICSDAFKRAAGGSCWGIGRELYYTGFIFVKCETELIPNSKKYRLVDKYVTYQVKEIKWNENPLTLKTLVIVNNKGEVVYSYGTSNKVPTTAQNQQQRPSGNQSITTEELSKEVNTMESEDLKIITDYYNSLNDIKKEQFSAWLFNVVGKTEISQLNETDIKRVANAIKKVK